VERSVFLSYSREDADWRERFLVVLNPLARNRGLELWADEYIRVGDEWRRAIDAALDRAAFALLLVSADFLQSRFIQDVEVPALRARGIRLACVLIGDCLWEESSTLASVQWAHDPRRDGPLGEDGVSARERTARIVRVCRTIAQLLDREHVETVNGEGVVSAADGAATTALEREVTLGPLHGVPELPPGYVARDELPALKGALAREGARSVGISGNVHALGLHGHGGIGKTVLACALARDEAVRRLFPDGVYWVSVGERGDVAALQIELLARLGVDADDLRSIGEGLLRLRETLLERRCLLVIDDVWSSAAASAFDAAGLESRVLYTTRDPGVLAPLAADLSQIDALPERAARQLLANLSGTSVDALPGVASDVLAATGRVALAVALMGAAVADGTRSWKQMVDDLAIGQETFLDHPYADVFKALQVGLSACDDDLAAAYGSLAVYPPDTRIPLAALGRYWAHLHGASASETRDRIDALAARELLTSDDHSILLHDLQRDFLVLYADHPTLVHADLLAAYRRLVPVGAAWSALPPGEPYIWENLLDHLRAAGDIRGLTTVARDLAYLVRRCHISGPYTAEADIRRAASLLPADPALAWLLRLFEQWRHLFSHHHEIQSLAVTVLSRVEDAPPGVRPEGLEPMLPREFLTPRWGLPDAPASLRRALEGHTGATRALVYAADGSSLASAGDDGVVRVWDRAHGRVLATLQGHRGGVRTVALSPDGAQLASAGDDGNVRLWGRRGQLLATLGGHNGGVAALAFSPDGMRLASAAEDGTVCLWESASWRQFAVLSGHSGGVAAVAFSVDGATLASAGVDAAVRLWNATDATAIAALRRHTGWIRALAFSPDGRLLASAGVDATICIWDPARLELVSELQGHAYGVGALSFSPNGARLASVGDDATVRIWDPWHGRALGTLRGHTDWVRSVVFSPDGRQLASAGIDATVQLWDALDLQSIATLRGHTGAVRSLSFSPDGSELASAGDDGIVRLWDPTRPDDNLPQGHDGVVSSLAFSPDGALLASAGIDATVRIWDPWNGRRLATLQGHTDWVRALAFSGQTGVLASAGADRTIRLWSTNDYHSTATLHGHTDWVTALVAAPDGTAFASASADGTVRLWDARRATPIHALDGHRGGVRAITFSLDGTHLISAGDDGTVRVWDPWRGRLVNTLRAHTGPVRAVLVTPDGSRIASAGDDGTAQIWDLAAVGQRAWHRVAGRRRAVEPLTLRGHQAGLSLLALSPDGDHLATAGGDRSVLLWDCRRGEIVNALQHASHAAHGLAFSPDGTRLVTTSAADDGTVALWEVPAGVYKSSIRLGLGIAAVRWGAAGVAIAAGQRVIVLQEGGRFTGPRPRDSSGLMRP
jgi:WD40 repeat protein